MNLDQNTRGASVLAKARRWASSFGVAALLLNVIAGPASAGTYDGAMGRTNYVVMTGDVNGDGHNDVLMKAVPKLVMIPIDDDLNVPIPIPVPSPTFALISTSYGNYTLVVNPTAETLASALWKAGTQQLVFAGASGASAGSVTITAASTDQASFVITMAADTGQLTRTSTTPPAAGPATNSSSSVPIPVLVETPHSTNPDAGTLPGGLSVSSGGSATYSIPLAVPPGTAGMQPNLSFNYSSQGANGMLGLGWSLGGLSSIHRCGKTIAQDKINNRISFSPSDRLCLDGQRLVRANLPAPTDNSAASADIAYWAAAGEYRTEIENFSRITAIAGPVIVGEAGPTMAFKVETKDGRTMYFGNTPTSYVRAIVGQINNGVGDQPSAKNGAQSWALASIVDRSGNHIKVSYAQNAATGEHHPTFIRYGGSGLPAHAAVEFVHKPRSDAWKKYVDESRNDSRNRIEQIQTYIGANLDGDVVANGTIVRNYALGYEYSPTSGRSLLASVLACARDSQSAAMKCLPKTSFAWGKPDPSKTPGFAHPAALPNGMWPGAPILTTANPTSIYGTKRGANHSDYFSFSDFDGDGRADVLEKRVASAIPADMAAYEGKFREAANPLTPGTIQASYRYFHNTGNGFVEYKYRLNTGANFVVLGTGDFNGDGATDLLIAGGKVCLSPLSQPAGLTYPTITFNCNAGPAASVGANNVGLMPYVVDVVGDGRSAFYGPIDYQAQSTLYIQGQELIESNPSNLIDNPSRGDDNHIDPVRDYVGFEQMVDFSGIGKPYDVRFSRTNWTSAIGGGRWNGLTPQMSMTGFGMPGDLSGAGKVSPYKYAFVPQASNGDAPYEFEKPGQGAGLSADFNGSGYSSLVFGYRQRDYNSGRANFYGRAETTLCLSTGRALDCGVRMKYSAERYSAVLAAGDFVGDGHPAILVEKLSSAAGPLQAPTHTGKLQMCRITGEDATNGAGIADANMACVDWAGANLPISRAVPLSTAPSALEDQVYFMDLLGTGRAQLVYYHTGKYDDYGLWKPGAGWEVFEPIDVAVSGQALDRIYQVTNGLGAINRVEYADGLASGIVSRSNTNTLSYPQRLTANPGKLVKVLARGNGVDSNGNQVYRTTRYQYKDAAIDQHGRGALGFGQVSSVDEQTKITTTSNYAQVFPHTGTLLSATTTTASCTLTSTAYGLSSSSLTQANGNVTLFPYVGNTTAQTRDLKCKDLGTVATSGIGQPNVEYDNWGNVLNTAIKTTGPDGLESHLTETVNTYYPADVGNWLFGQTKRAVVTKSRSADAARVARTVALTYEPGASGKVLSMTQEPDDATLRVQTTYHRGDNPFGLVNKQTEEWVNPACQSANWPEVGCVINKSRTTHTAYDSNGRFPLSIKNALGHEELHDYYPQTGVKRSLTGPNTLTTSWVADGFGRVSLEKRADGNETRYYAKTCNGDCPTGAVSAQVVETFYGNARTSVPQVSYSDNVGHVLRTLTYGFDGRRIVTDQRYDSLGRVFEMDLPRFESDARHLASRQLYDDSHRVIEVVTISDVGGELSSTVDHDGMVTTLTNPKKQVRVETRDAIGQLKQVRDPNLGLTKFEYEPFGGLAKTTDPAGNVISVSYDKLGRKTDLRDPNLGWIHYDVDPVGQTYAQTSPKQRSSSQRTGMTYDLLGRMTARYESDLESHWVFDTAVKGIGQLAEAYTGPQGGKDYQRLHSYDSLGRPSAVTQKLSDATYASVPEYDAWGRLVTQTYRRGTDVPKVFATRYSNTGYLARVERGSLVLWSVLEQDAAQRVTKLALGNGLTQDRKFNPITGRLDNGLLKTAGDVGRLQETYYYDVLGSVTERVQYWDVNGFQEGFTYDALNRLETAKLGQVTQTFVYDNGGIGAGNLSSKTGTGVYTYPAPGELRPHAVKSITGIGEFLYDENGNLTSGAGRTISWNSFDMPVQFTGKAGVGAHFVYGPEHQRTRQNRSDGSVVVYAGAQEVESKAGQVTVKTYWPGGIGVEIDRPGAATPELNWTHVDRLGSLMGLTDQNGVLREKLAFDAWGKRRTLDGKPDLSVGSNTPDSLDGKVDNRGFTGHEMLDQLDLVHMNGRVYDPSIGKFLSSDLLIQDPTNGQSYNRYSYVLNNPTNFTDPTGFEAVKKEEEKNRKEEIVPCTGQRTGGGCMNSVSCSGTCTAEEIDAVRLDQERRDADRKKNAKGNSTGSANTGTQQKGDPNERAHRIEYAKLGIPSEGAAMREADYQDWAAGKGYISREEHSDGIKARGTGALIGGAVVLTGAVVVQAAEVMAIRQMQRMTLDQLKNVIKGQAGGVELLNANGLFGSGIPGAQAALARAIAGSEASVLAGGSVAVSPKALQAYRIIATNAKNANVEVQQIRVKIIDIYLRQMGAKIP